MLAFTSSILYVLCRWAHVERPVLQIAAETSEQWMQIFVLTHLKPQDHIWICLFVPVTSNGFKLITTAQNNLRLNRKAKMFYSLSPPHYKIRWAYCQWYLALCSADSLQSVIVTKLALQWDRAVCSELNRERHFLLHRGSRYDDGPPLILVIP